MSAIMVDGLCNPSWGLRSYLYSIVKELEKTKNGIKAHAKNSYCRLVVNNNRCALEQKIAPKQMGLS